MLVPVLRMVYLLSVEIIGELMQEIHQIRYQNELEINLFLVSISIKGIFNYSD